MKAKLVKENINETRFSTLEIPFVKEDIIDKTKDAKWYVQQIEDNLLEVDLSKNTFKFKLAFDKLKKCLDDIINAKETSVSNEI